jgi:hypothetical protein
MADRTRTSPAPTASGSGEPVDQEAGGCSFPVSPLAAIFARARADHAQATWLLAMPRPERLEALHRDASLRHLSLARLLSLRAEEAFEDDPDAAEEAAELAVTIAAALPVDPDGRVQRVAAVACWLLGKARLRAQPARGTWSSPARLDTVEQAFAAIRHIAASDALSWERSLAALGLAQLRWQQHRRVESSAFFALATRHLACSHAPQQLAACHLQHGFLLLGRGELLLARQELAGAQASPPATRRSTAPPPPACTWREPVPALPWCPRPTPPSRRPGERCSKSAPTSRKRPPSPGSSSSAPSSSCAPARPGAPTCQRPSSASPIA